MENTREDRDNLRAANKIAKKTVAKVKVLDDLNDILETTEEQKEIYCIAKAGNRVSKDFTNIRQMKNEKEVVHYDKR